MSGRDEAGKECVTQMRIIFVRHGHPNYDLDCLTSLGHKHGEAVAERLKREPVEKIFSSTCGRAMETAQHIDVNFGLGVEGLEFMREIKWGSSDGTPIYEDGHPWLNSDYLVEQGRNLLNSEWRETEQYRNNKVVAAADALAKEFDTWLAGLGYTREGEYYRVGKVLYGTVVLVSHGGASSAALARFFNLPFPFVCSAICPDYTAVTVVALSEEEGSLVAPKFEIMNDARHIARIKKETEGFVFA